MFLRCILELNNRKLTLIIQLTFYVIFKQKLLTNVSFLTEHVYDLCVCRYRNQYPILGLLSDDYQVTSPVKEAKTIVIERTGEMIKQVKEETTK